jgi:hypothetical protein
MSNPSSAAPEPDDVAVTVCYAAEKDIGDWFYTSNPEGTPFIFHRVEGTTGAQFQGSPLPDGWVLHIGDGDTWMTGVRELIDVDDAVGRARDHLRTLREAAIQLDQFNANDLDNGGSEDTEGR